MINERHELLCHVGENLKFSGIQWIAEQLQQEDIRTV